MASSSSHLNTSPASAASEMKNLSVNQAEPEIETDSASVPAKKLKTMLHEVVFNDGRHSSKIATIRCVELEYPPEQVVRVIIRDRSSNEVGTLAVQSMHINQIIEMVPRAEITPIGEPFAVPRNSGGRRRFETSAPTAFRMPSYGYQFPFKNNKNQNQEYNIYPKNEVGADPQSSSGVVDDSVPGDMNPPSSANGITPTHQNDPNSHLRIPRINLQTLTRHVSSLIRACNKAGKKITRKEVLETFTGTLELIIERSTIESADGSLELIADHLGNAENIPSGGSGDSSTLASESSASASGSGSASPPSKPNFYHGRGGYQRPFYGRGNRGGGGFFPSYPYAYRGGFYPQYNPNVPYQYPRHHSLPGNGTMPLASPSSTAPTPPMLPQAPYAYRPFFPATQYMHSGAAPFYQGAYNPAFYPASQFNGNVEPVPSTGPNSSAVVDSQGMVHINPLVSMAADLSSTSPAPSSALLFPVGNVVNGGGFQFVKRPEGLPPSSSSVPNSDNHETNGHDANDTTAAASSSQGKKAVSPSGNQSNDGGSKKTKKGGNAGGGGGAGGGGVRRK